MAPPFSKRTITAKRFCISTGSRPAIPPVDGLEEIGFLTNESVFQIKKLPHSLIVLGGGPIGLELGQSFARFGSDVTVVEMDKRLLPKEDEEVSATIGAIMRTEGLKILLNHKALRALKLTLAPQDVREEDLAALREAELSDVAIHDATVIIAYFNFVNRMASGLGVELEQGHT